MAGPRTDELNSQSLNKHPLSTPVQFVKGVGPVVAKKLEKLGACNVSGLFSILPIRYQDRRVISKICDLMPEKDMTICAKVLNSRVVFFGRRRVFEAMVGDETGSVSLRWFQFTQKTFEKRFHNDAKFIISGMVNIFKNTVHFVHPQTELIEEDDTLINSQIAGRILPVYPLTEGVSQRQIRKVVFNAWEKFHQYIETTIPKYICERYKILPSRISLKEIHFPDHDVEIEKLEDRNFPAKRSLIFDELFFLQLGLALRKKDVEDFRTTSYSHDQNLYNKFISALGFELTNAQKRVILEIQGDLDRTRPMNRLLQGDVGSGKTVVCLAAALQVISGGGQAAIMVPTEILAAQHYKKISAIFEKIGLDCALLTGSTTERDRVQIMNRLMTGKISLLVGTHTLIEEAVEFKNLGFVVIDEQHRFGVRQRAKIKSKGSQPHTLIMTATPIPRTLAMTIYGDLDVSVIDEMPPNRTPVITRLYSEKNRTRLYDGILKVLNSKRQIYVVCPLIEKSEELDLKAAEDVCKKMKEIFSEFKVELLHGRMKGDEKDLIMSQFGGGKIDILVTTTVIEVGVDVPNATVMVIEHAERFGLSQLHQLRGRVGRGDKQSFCILMADYKQSADAKQRLRVMVETTDGFKIAEEDLNIRGPGEFIGTRQSGYPPFRIANLACDGRILQEARDAAFELLKRDPQLSMSEHHKVRETLQIRWGGRLELVGVS